VVAAALGAVGVDSSGLTSAVNNTARQACGAIGIAAFGAIAGQPGSHNFIPGLHTVALITAALFLAGAITTLGLIHQPHNNEAPQ
jgi:DHA2 family methylenomycin A resistance protein-like MFS transporter